MTGIALTPEKSNISDKLSGHPSAPIDIDTLKTCALETMKTDLQGKLRNVPLPTNQPLLPLFEAVVNAIEAIREAGDVSDPAIRIEAVRDKDLIDESAAAFIDFFVHDNGIGFTDTNYRSFETSNSRHKESRGGKGLGRFTWLKAFERAEIDSCFRENERLRHRRFDFSPYNDDLRSKPAKTSKDNPGTTIGLRGFLDPWKKSCPCELVVIAHRLTEHLVLHLLDENCPRIELTDGQDTINIGTYFRHNFAAHAETHDVNIGASKFKVTGFRMSEATWRHHQALFTAHQRVVLAKRLNKIIPNLSDLRIEDPNQGRFLYRVYIESTVLDEHVNNERTDFLLPEIDDADEQEGLFGSLPSMKGILDAVVEKVEGDLQPWLSQIEDDKKRHVERYINEQAPQYHPLKAHMGDVVKKLPAAPNEKAMERALHEKRSEMERELREESREIIDGLPAGAGKKDYEEKFRYFMQRHDALGVAALANHVLHRRIMLDILEKALKQDPETHKHARESTLHEMFFPRFKTSTDVAYEEQNLWMIDERLTYHRHLYSDIALNKIKEIDTSSRKRPDILIFDGPFAFSGDGPGEQLSSVTLFEFKRPNPKAKSDQDPLSQAYNLIRKIRGGKLNDVNGRPINERKAELPAYIYIVCDLPAFKSKIEDLGAFRTPDEQGYYGFNPTLNAYFEVLSYDKILADAHRRNRILFDKLNLPRTLGAASADKPN